MFRSCTLVIISLYYILTGSYTICVCGVLCGGRDLVPHRVPHAHTSQWSCSLRFSHQNPVCILLFPLCTICPAHFILLGFIL
jgi:hypothetical protein